MNTPPPLITTGRTSYAEIGAGVSRENTDTLDTFPPAVLVEAPTPTTRHVTVDEILAAARALVTRTNDPDARLSGAALLAILDRRPSHVIVNATCGSVFVDRTANRWHSSEEIRDLAAHLIRKAEDAEGLLETYGAPRPARESVTGADPDESPMDSFVLGNPVEIKTTRRRR